MARNPNRTSLGTLPDNGKIVFASQRKGKTWTLHFKPKASAIELAKEINPTFEPSSGPILLAKADNDAGWVEVYPTNTTAFSHGLFGPKYPLLRTIRFEKLTMLSASAMEDARWVLGRLIDGFVTTPEAGLGIDFELISIVEELEAAKVSRLIVRAGPRKGLPAFLPDGSLMIAGVQFDESRRAVRRIHNKALAQARDEKHRTVHNSLLTVADAARFPEQQPPYIRGAIVAAIRAGAENRLATKDQDATLSAIAPIARKVASRKPQAAQQLVREIELATLEQLIARFEKRLSANSDEETWQRFFKTHPFVLKLAFGYPILAMGDQVSVGGGRFDGKGEKIADFTAMAALSGNLAIIEIKKPGTRLLGKIPYRDGVYAPARELSGSVTQVLDQKYQLQMDFAAKKVKSRAWEVEAYAIHCLVVIGKNPTFDDEKKSFELFRRDLRQVSVITFDELLAKLKTILDFLKADLPKEPEAGTGSETSASSQDKGNLMEDEDLTPETQDQGGPEEAED